MRVFLHEVHLQSLDPVAVVQMPTYCRDVTDIITASTHSGPHIYLYTSTDMGVQTCMFMYVCRSLPLRTQTQINSLLFQLLFSYSVDISMLLPC